MKPHQGAVVLGSSGRRSSEITLPSCGAPSTRPRCGRPCGWRRARSRSPQRLADDVGGAGGIALHRAGAGHVAHGAEAHGARSPPSRRPRAASRRSAAPAGPAAHHLARVGVVEVRQRDVLARDVEPHVQLGPVADREGAEVLARADAGVEQRPQLGALPWLPLAEAVAVAEDALLGAGLLSSRRAPPISTSNGAPRWPSAASRSGARRCAIPRVRQAHGAARRWSPPDGPRPGARPSRRRGGRGTDHLGKLWPGVDVSSGRRDAAHPKGLLGAAQHQQESLPPRTAGRALEGGGDFAQDEDGLFLQPVEVG